MKGVLFALLLGCLASIVAPASQAAAQCQDEACVRTSTTTGNVNTQQSAVLDATLNSLFGAGQSVDLTVADDNALASTNIKLGDLTAALNAQGVGTDASTALSTQASLSTVLQAMATTARNAGNTGAADAIDTLRMQTAAVNAGTITLGNLISTDTRSGPLANAQLNALDLVSGTASLFNSKNVAAVNNISLTGSQLGLGSAISNVQVALVVVEPALFVCGPAGTQFFSASVRVRARVQLTGSGLDLTVPGLTSARLNLTSFELVAAVGRAAGTIQAIDATLGTLTVSATPGIAELYLGTISDANFLDRTTAIDPVTEVTPAVIANLALRLLLVNATASVTAKSYARGTTPSAQTLSFTGPYAQTRTATTQAGFAGTLVDTLLSNLVVSVGPITPSLGIVGPALTTLLNDLLTTVTNALKSTSGILKPLLDQTATGVLDPLLSGLGIKLGEVSVTASAPYKVPAGSACNDLSFCTESDVCGANGVCAGTVKTCSDGLSCTADTCNDASGVCVNTPSNACLINGACFAAGTTDPSNDCRACVPSSSTTTWSIKPAGASCNDGLFCTTSDSCNALGLCTALPRDCSDGLLCTIDACDEGADSCTNLITLGCVVGGACVLPGADDPSNACRSCNPLLSTVAFSNKTAGATCSDGAFCTVSDACDGAGSCTSQARNCEDGLGCTSNSCDETNDSCTASLSGGCLINGSCIAAGTTDPLNACRSCNPALSTIGFTNKSPGAACDDGLFCTTGESCNGAGLCQGAPRVCGASGQGCTSVCDEAQDLCRNDTNGCLIDGACLAAGTEDPTNPCRSCVPSVSTSGWTLKAVGSACNDNLFCTTGDACNAGGTCAGGARDCNDNLSCTTDSCDEVNDRCGITTDSGCVIGGACVASGALNPSNPCQSCNPGASATSWTSLAAGVACDDGLFCTTGETCNGEGRCLGTARDCNQGSAGCVSVCDELANVCRSGLLSCNIDGACQALGAVDPNNPCRECNPLLSTSTWSNKLSGASCDDGQYCTIGESCNAQGACVGTPRGCGGNNGTCGNLCNEALDTCSVGTAGCNIDGVCRAAGDSDPLNSCRVCNPALSPTTWSLKGEGTSCSDGLFCTNNDVCSAAGVCAGSPTACNDGLGCTTDACDETVRRCTSTVVSGCLIDGACQASGTTDPGNTCRGCDPARSTATWSLRPVDSGCDDGQFCTVGETCSAQGVCRGSLRSCSAGGACTSFCDEASDSCRDDVDGCAIDELCLAAGVDDPNNPCRTCNPDLAVNAWSLKPVDAACNDGLFCTANEKCTAQGVCAGPARDCADTQSCTVDSCDETNDLCTHVSGSSCLIDGACYPAGSNGPEGPCRTCDPARSTTSWTNAAVNTVCDDGSFCTLVDACDGAGACTGSGATCTAETNDCETQTCDETTDTCRFLVTVGCKIDNTCVATGALSAGDPCLVCQPARATTTWSFDSESPGCDRLEDGGIDMGNELPVDDAGVRDGGGALGDAGMVPTRPIDEEDEDGRSRRGGLAGGALCSAAPGGDRPDTTGWIVLCLGAGLWVRRRRSGPRV